MTKDTLAAMRAEEQKRMAAVPDALVAQLGERMFDDAHENCGSDGEGCTGGGLPYYEDYARVLLADLLPEHERLIRERVAKENGTAAGSLFEGDPATCAEPGCITQIDPVLAYQCGEASSDGENRCGGYFCYEHIHRSPVDDEPCCSACLTVPAHLRAWSVPYLAYRPVDITPPELLPDQGLQESLEASVAEGWAEPYTDPALLPDLAARGAAALIPYDLDANGRPRHPGGRTGKIGRNLGRWGENAAADPIVVTGTGTGRRVLLIRRDDCEQWAIPGGMVEPGETAPAALVRELREETGVDLSGITPTILTRTLVADLRETDWAWVATTLALFQIREQITPTAGDDAVDARWFSFADLRTLTQALAEQDGVLYEAHRPLLTLALDRLNRR